MSQSLLESTGLSTTQLCGGLGLSYSSFQRWRHRHDLGLPVLRAPGPAKVGPLPLEELHDQLEALVPRAKRTRGTRAAYRCLAAGISRRNFQTMVNARRCAHLRRQRQKLKRIRWKEPNLAWAIDATETHRDVHGGKLLQVVVQDLASSYRFEPFLDFVLCGDETARYLEKLFGQHGAPLFLKRDNGGIFNTPAVNDLLARFGVIPLNSPVRYPRYNGAIENGIGEHKRTAAELLPSVKRLSPQNARPLFRFVVLKRNFHPRRSLGYRTAAAVYTQGPKIKWTRRERQKIFAWIGARAKRMLSAMEHPNHCHLRRAWRRSAEAWLRCQGLIEVSINQKPVTPF